MQDDQRFANLFALHCLEDIKRLVMTMKEKDFVHNKFYKNDEMAQIVQNLLLQLKTMIGQAWHQKVVPTLYIQCSCVQVPPTAPESVRAMNQEKLKNIMEESR